MTTDPQMNLEDGVRAGVLGFKDALRQHLEGVMNQQLVHPVHPRVEVLWDVPYSITSVTMRLGGILEEVSPEVVAKRVAARNRLIEQETRDPLRYACEPEIWRLIDIEMCKKRLANPGLVLELLVTGGIRAGKTEGATRRVNANFFYTPKGWCVGLHETDITSRSIQQSRVNRFLPPELDTGTGKHKKDKRTKFSYSEATGFTGSEFNIYWTCYDELGVQMESGGRYEFRFYKQDLSTLQGLELTCATSDELVPLTIVKTIRERLSTRATDTAKPEFLARIRKALDMLERGEPLPTPLLGAIYHGCHLITFTPKEGWNATINSFLNKAKKYGRVPAPLLENVSGCKDKTVPRFAQPQERWRLVAYLHTSDNVMRSSYEAVAAQLEGKSEQEIRVVAYGDVDKDWQSEFSAAYDSDLHGCDWKDFPRTGTIYEVFDPAGAKPWAMGWYLVDELDRIWMLQEWPCESIPVNDSLPGPWAVDSVADRLNGDEGSAYKLRLAWSISRWNLQIWEGRVRILAMLAKSGEAWRGETVKHKLVLPNGQPAEEQSFLCVERSIIDSRFAGTRIDSPKGGEQVTVLDRMFDDANPILCEPAQGVMMDEGNMLIADKLSARVLGDQVALRINRECTNTHYMLLNYTLPVFRETTQRKDEACKEWRDLLAYLLLARPEYIDPTPRRQTGITFGTKL